MPLLQVQRHVRGVRALDREDYRLLIKDSYGFLAEDWHEYLRPIHFTPEGARKYRYKERKTKHVQEGKAKRRKRSGRPLAPDGNPLVWSGKSRELSRTARIVATFNQGRAVMPVRALNFRPNGIDLRAEFTVVTAEESAAQQRKVKRRQVWWLRNRSKIKAKFIS